MDLPGLLPCCEGYKDSMQAHGELMRTGPRSTRRVFWLGLSSLVVAALSWVFAWDGGLWALPLWLALTVATWRAARRRARPWVDVGTAMAALAVIVGTYGLVSSGGMQPAVRSDASWYVSGAEVGVQLRAGVRSVGYNLCVAFAGLEQHDGTGGWAPLDVNLGPPGSGDSMCTLEQRVLNPLLGARGSVYLPKGLPSGTYRLVYRVEVGGERRQLATSDFTVT